MTQSTTAATTLKQDEADNIIRARFYLPSTGKYTFYRIKIAPSTIKDAGSGAFAVDEIPFGAEGVYRGVRKSLDNANIPYSWEIYDYDLRTGIPKDTKQPIFYIDASEDTKSNWARFVNCGIKRRHNNLYAEQRYDKLYYISSKTIKPGEELFIDYGAAYRKNNLKFTGRY
jgi:hypothetical protein